MEWTSRKSENAAILTGQLSRRNNNEKNIQVTFISVGYFYILYSSWAIVKKCFFWITYDQGSIRKFGVFLAIWNINILYVSSFPVIIFPMPKIMGRRK